MRRPAPASGFGTFARRGSVIETVQYSMTFHWPLVTDARTATPAKPSLIMFATTDRTCRPEVIRTEEGWGGAAVSAAIRISPLTARKKALRPSQSVSRFASRRAATLPRTPIRRA